MVSARIWSVINVSLVLVAFVLFLNLLNVNVPTLGKALYQFDTNEEICISAFDGSNNLVPVNSCCLELQLQLIKGERSNQEIIIDGETFEVDKKYYTGSSTIDYYINQKAYRYCNNNGFLV